MLLALRIGGQASTGCPGLPRGQTMPVCSVPCRRGTSFQLPFIPTSTSQYHELTQDALYTFLWVDCLGPLEGSPKRATEQLRRPKPSFQPPISLLPVPQPGCPSLWDIRVPGRDPSALAWGKGLGSTLGSWPVEEETRQMEGGFCCGGIGNGGL